MVGVTKHERLEKRTVEFKADNECASYIVTKPIHARQRLVSKKQS